MLSNMSKLSCVWRINLSFFIYLIISCSVLHVQAAPQSSLITKLPGFNGTFPSKHYSGYVRLEEGNSSTKNLFYYFVISERNPTTDPVVLWLNGGPGCSSFDGFVYEHGPFNFEKAKRRSSGGLPILHLNPYSWSKVSSIIYLDSPAGVGFSYPTSPTGDLQTASDTHAFLLKWFEQFPEFLSNPFYLAGESYAGIYVPTLAAQVVKGIKSGIKPIINFKGYMVGNGVCDNKFDGNALVPFAHGMGLISNAFFKEAKRACKENYQSIINQKCDAIMEKIYSVLDGLNIYDTLEPCYHGDYQHNIGRDNGGKRNTSTRLPMSFKELGKSTERPLPVRKRMFGRAWPYRAPVLDGIVPLWPQLSQKNHVPCVDEEIASIWLNDYDVREAIHASPESGEWSLCTGGFDFDHDAGSMIAYHKNLTADGYRALIFSGDHDMCVPFTGTQAWTESLGYQVVDEWRPWNLDDQIAGYVQAYANGLTFMTIKGAGHTVPEYKPKEALEFYRRWLEGQKI
ncbi:hypothetical protein M9H77_34986 [Catharanthus roseus]|uniref:Uncharacterized protein n=1 Tax=Catharanthus roseus TaxID=4058 RepID=A0ACB9ZMQ7_CATRO|nr:hypothetical protein M9H77_34986 [Catharanthus roseus]